MMHVHRSPQSTRQTSPGGAGRTVWSEFARVLLWLFVINLGTAFGAGVYEHRIVLPDWFTTDADGLPHWDPAAAAASDTGRRFWAFVTTGPLTLLTIGNLVAAWRTRGPARGVWLGASITALTERLLTFAYLIPTMVGLLAAADAAQALETAQVWGQVNHLRHLLVFGAWLTAMRALTRLHESGGILTGECRGVSHTAAATYEDPPLRQDEGLDPSDL